MTFVEGGRPKKKSRQEQLEYLIESILFLTAREYSPESLAKVVKRSVSNVSKALTSLKEKYNKADLPFEIKLVDGKYSMNLKPDAAELVRRYVRVAEVTGKPLQILGYIAKHRGVLKSKVAKVFGSSAYQAIKELVSKGFVVEMKVGRTSRLSVTKKFEEYFEGQSFSE